MNVSPPEAGRDKLHRVRAGRRPGRNHILANAFSSHRTGRRPYRSRTAPAAAGQTHSRRAGAGRGRGAQPWADAVDTSDDRDADDARPHVAAAAREGDFRDLPAAPIAYDGKHE